MSFVDSTLKARVDDLWLECVTIISLNPTTFDPQKYSGRTAKELRLLVAKQDDNGNNLLHHAAQNIDAGLPIFEWLVCNDGSNGASLTTRNRDENTPLHLVLQFHNNRTAVVTFLFGIAPARCFNIARKDGNTLMHICGMNGLAALFVAIMKSGGDPMLENAEEQTALELLILKLTAQRKKERAAAKAQISLLSSLVRAQAPYVPPAVMKQRVVNGSGSLQRTVSVVSVSPLRSGLSINDLDLNLRHVATETKAKTGPPPVPPAGPPVGHQNNRSEITNDVTKPTSVAPPVPTRVAPQQQSETATSALLLRGQQESLFFCVARRMPAAGTGVTSNGSMNVVDKGKGKAGIDDPLPAIEIQAAEGTTEAPSVSVEVRSDVNPSVQTVHNGAQDAKEHGNAVPQHVDDNVTTTVEASGPDTEVSPANEVNTAVEDAANASVITMSTPDSSVPPDAPQLDAVTRRPTNDPSPLSQIRSHHLSIRLRKSVHTASDDAIADDDIAAQIEKEMLNRRGSLRLDKRDDESENTDDNGADGKTDEWSDDWRIRRRKAIA